MPDTLRKSIIESINNIESSFGTTAQIYTVLIHVVSGRGKVKERFRPLARKLLRKSYKDIPGSVSMKALIEPSNPDNYFISHHYNFVLNLIGYIAIGKLLEGDEDPEKLIEIRTNLAKFLMHEKELLTLDSIKTVGFELVVGKYIHEVIEFTDVTFVKKYVQARKDRLAKFSHTLVFTPEGVSSYIDRIKLRFVVGNMPMQVGDAYVLNSPDASLRYIDRVEKIFGGEQSEKLLKYGETRSGYPPFFVAEFLDFFWIADIIFSAGLQEEFKDCFVEYIQNSGLFTKDLSGCWNDLKGVSMAKGFPLYDSDTTSMLLRILFYLKETIGIEDEFFNYDFSYYKRNGLYDSYKNDNRISPSTNAHVLSFFALRNIKMKKLQKYLEELMTKEKISDKWHASEMYPLYTIGVAFVELSKKGLVKDSIFDLLLNRIFSHQKSDGGLSSINGFVCGTVEESSWGYLLIHCLRKVSIGRTKSFNRQIKSLEEYLINSNLNTIDPESLEKMWVVKQIYSMNTINQVLFQTVYYLVNNR